MRRAFLLTAFLPLAACPTTGGDGQGPAFFEPGTPIDLGRRPLARLASPVIVSRGADITLTGTAFFYVVDNNCGVNGCNPFVVEAPEPLCVALRGAPHCEHAVTPHTVDTAASGAGLFFGRFERTMTTTPGLAAEGLTLTGITASSPLSDGHVGLPDPGDRLETLHLVVVGEGDDATVDLAPEGIPVEQTLGGVDTDDGVGLILVRRDGQLVALDSVATATTGGLVGGAVGDVYLDENGGRNVAGGPVGSDVLVVRMTPTDRFDPLELSLPDGARPMRLFFEVLPGTTTPAPLRPFRLVRASTPTPASVRACFNRRLDLATLSALTLDIADAPARGTVTALSGGQCVLVQTAAQVPLAGLTITASGGLRSIAGEDLKASTVGLQAPPRRVESVTRLFPLIEAGLEPAPGVEAFLEPEQDGRVRVNGGELLDGSFLELIPSAVAEAGVRSGQGRTPLPDRTGLWVTVDEGVGLVDGDEITRFTTPAPRTNLFPLDNGAVVFGTTTGAVHLAADGTLTDLPAPASLPGAVLETPVIDRDLAMLWVDPSTLQHVLVDAAGLEKARFARTATILWAAESGGTLFAADDQVGLVTIDVTTSTVTPRLPITGFGGWSRLGDGGLELYATRPDGRSPVLRLRDGILTTLAIPDADGVDASSLGAARIVGELAFVYGFRHSALFQSRSQLRVMHKDTWEVLQQDAEEAP